MFNIHRAMLLGYMSVHLVQVDQELAWQPSSGKYLPGKCKFAQYLAQYLVDSPSLPDQSRLI